MGDGTILTRIKEFFGYKTLAEFAKDWKLLSDEDKAQIKSGIEDGSLTY